MAHKIERMNDEEIAKTVSDHINELEGSDPPYSEVGLAQHIKTRLKKITPEGSKWNEIAIAEIIAFDLQPSDTVQGPWNTYYQPMMYGKLPD